MNPKKILDDLLAKNAQIIIFVLPSECVGLSDFSGDRPLKLNLGHALLPAMCIQTDEAHLVFRASFNRIERVVHVPWSGLLFAGTEANFAECVRAAYAIERRDVTAATSVDPAHGNVVQVDFRRGRRPTGPTGAA